MNGKGPILKHGLSSLIVISFLWLTVTASTASDTQSPTVPKDLAATGKNHTTITLSWTDSYDNIKVQGYQLFKDGKKVGSTSDTYYECKRLNPGTSYVFYVRAYDKAGNYSAYSSEITASTISDKTAPSTPSRLNTSSVTVTEANLTWQPASDNVKVKGYDIIRDGVKVGTTSKTIYCSKSLIPGKSYTYTVRAVDTSGNLSKSSSQLTVSTLKDTQAPTAPSGLIVTAVKNSSVHLSWTASTDNAKVVGYQIYCNGIVITTAARTSRVVKSPFGFGIDVYWLKAYDQTGNLSGSSNAITVVTPLK